MVERMVDRLDPSRVGWLGKLSVDWRADWSDGQMAAQMVTGWVDLTVLWKAASMVELRVVKMVGYLDYQLVEKLVVYLAVWKVGPMETNWVDQTDYMLAVN